MMDIILTPKLKNVKLVPNNVEPVMLMASVWLVPLLLLPIIMNVISTVLEELSYTEQMNVCLVINPVLTAMKKQPNVKYVLMDISCKLPKLYLVQQVHIVELV